MVLKKSSEKLNRRNQKGFTLVELIVVIAIIGILAGVMLPKYFGFTDDAREKEVISEAKNLRTIAETYYANNGTWPTITITGSGADAVVTLQGNDTAFKGTISSYEAAAAGTAVTSGNKISGDGSFNYVKTGIKWRASCNPDGKITTVKTT